MDFEEAISRNLFKQDYERSFIDKILSRADVDRIRELIRKKSLKREELLEILYLLSSNESKLLNLGSWDRYILLKYFVWIREFIKIVEQLYDYTDDLEAKEKRKEIILSDRTRQLLKNIERQIEHNAKFLIDLYFNIARTTLSLGATGMMELLKNKYEIVYPQQSIQTNIKEKKGGLVT